MRVKRSYYNNNPLRPVRGGTGPTPSTTTDPASSRVLVYPNPAGASARVVLTVPEGETPTAVQVFNLTTGQRVGQSTDAQLRAGELRLHTLLPAGLRAGLYVVRLTTDAGVYTERFEYQP